MFSGQIYTEINKTEKIYFLFCELERNWTEIGQKDLAYCSYPL